MANPNKFTAKEVLNKVLLDSSGNAVTANSVTSQEALNSVLDTTNNRLNMSLAGGTISGDVTISGDLTVNGGGLMAYSEVLTGDFQIVGANGTVSGTPDVDGDEFIIRNNADAGMSILAGESSGHTSSVIFGSTSDLNGANVFYDYHSKTFTVGTQHSSGILKLRSGNGTDALTIDSSQNATFSGSVGIGISGTPSQLLHIASPTDAFIQLERVDTTVANNDAIGAILFRGGESSIADIGRIRLHADADFTSSSSPTKMVFETTPSGSTVDAVALTLDSSQNATFAQNINLGDDKALTLGANDDSQIFNTGSHLFIRNNTSDQDIIFQVNDGGSTQTEVMRIDASVPSVNITGDLNISKAGNATLNIKNSSDGLSDEGEIGTIEFEGSDGSANRAGVMAKIVSRYSDTGSGDAIDGSANEGGSLGFFTSIATGVGSSQTLAEKMRIENNGNVGIGIATPYSILHIDSGGDPTSVPTSGQNNIGIGETGTSNGYVSIGFGVAGGTGNYRPAAITYKNTQNGGNQAGELGFWTRNTTTASDAPTQRMVITDGGEVGIGTSSPSDYNALANNLVVYENGDGGITIASSTSGTGSLYFADDTSGDNAYKGSIEYVHGSTNELRFRANSVVRFVLDTNSRISLSNNDSGTNNTVFGYQAGNAIASGTNSNVLVGYQSGLALNSGDANVLIGTSAGDAMTSASSNVAIGGSALGASTDIDKAVCIGNDAMQGVATSDADGTVAIGATSLFALTSGKKNIAIGFQAQKETTIGDSNIAIGYNAMFGDGGLQNDLNIAIGSENAAGSVLAAMGGQWTSNRCEQNIAIGTGSLAGAMNDSHDNVAVGYKSLNAVTTADDNVAIGSGAGEVTVSGGANTIVGYQALNGDVDGDGADNTALGHKALHDAVSPSKNVAIGDSAMRGLAGPANGISDCVAIGANAFYGSGDNTTVDTNGTVAIGKDSLKALTTGVGNVAVGSNTLEDITTGGYNTVVGTQALQNAQVGVSLSTAIGFRAGYKLGDDGVSDHSDANIMIGYSALGGGSGTVGNNTANHNIAIGNNSLGGSEASTASTMAGNTVIGHDASKVATNGADNTVIGKDACSTMTTGYFNTVIGKGANPSAVGGTNQIVIGRATTGTGDNEIALGNTSISAIKAQVTSITAYSSDERTKKNVEDYDLKGVDFIKELNLKTYIYKNPADFPDEIRDSKWDEDGVERLEDPTEIQVGLIAQEVESALAKHGVGNTETYAPTQDNGIKTLTYGNLIFPLIKAVQELSARVEELEKK